MGEDDGDGGNPGTPSLAVRVGSLEVAMSSVQTDIRWIKLFVAPTFIISVISLLLLVATVIPR